jgi:hypothetical protein
MLTLCLTLRDRHRPLTRRASPPIWSAAPVAAGLSLPCRNELICASASGLATLGRACYACDLPCHFVALDGVGRL